MGINHVLLGKAGHGWFADVVCDGDHNYNGCGSGLPDCSFENLDCGKAYSECLRLATNAAIKHGVPLVNESTEKTRAPYNAYGMIKEETGAGFYLPLIIWKFDESDTKVFAGYQGQPPLWYTVQQHEESEFGRFFEMGGQSRFLNEIVPLEKYRKLA